MTISHFDYCVKTPRAQKVFKPPFNFVVIAMNVQSEIMISTNKGRVIRVQVKEIRIAGRNTQGVRIIKLSGEEKVVSAIKIEDNID